MDNSLVANAVFVNGATHAALGGTAPDATAYEDGDTIADADNPGTVYHVYDSTTSCGVTQIGT